MLDSLILALAIAMSPPVDSACRPTLVPAGMICAPRRTPQAQKPAVAAVPAIAPTVPETAPKVD